jgi:hypothetical protein
MRNGKNKSVARDAALDYIAKFGWVVFEALIIWDKKEEKWKKQGRHKAAKTNGNNWGYTKDPAEIQKLGYWNKYPNDPIGIPTGSVNGFFVIEADTPKGHEVDGVASLAELEAKHSPLPKTRMARSPSGSIHYYFNYPEGAEFAGTANELAPGVDVLGEGRMVIAPPSFNPKYNGHYEWVNEEPIADAPAWLLDLLTEKETEKAEPQAMVAYPQGLLGEALALIPNDGGYSELRNMGLLIFGATAGSAAGFKMFDRYSQKTTAHTYKSEVAQETWEDISTRPPEAAAGACAGKILKLADKASPGWRTDTSTWRERGKGGIPIASMHNARVAITALGIECSHDVFHTKMLFGFRDDAVRYDLGEEMSDYAVIRLRQIISDQFGFDPKEQNTRDAVISLALDHCFDPVCDFIDKAQAEWDDVPRLDRMAVDYFNCEDTLLNRALVRKMMIALVHRPRVPGCKFDNIVVLEGPEGWNKSSAFKELAGDENFSDESILGAKGREVQEQLSTIWIHESADLAGMHKADVEQVKAFASRTTDIARGAYGHFVTKQKRHSIEVGTTNSEEYLQSQTGNRRFWPLKLLERIDLGKLRKDRLQLIGEAAKYESEGEGVTLPEALWDAAAEEQEKRRTKDPWEDLIDGMTFKGATVSDGDFAWKAVIHLIDNQERVATSDIFDNVLQIPPVQQSRGFQMRLSEVMKRLRWQRDGKNKITIGGKQVRGYYRQAGMAPVQTVTVRSDGEDTTDADAIKTAGFEVASHMELVGTKGRDKGQVHQTQITLVKSLPPELLALIESDPAGGLSKDPRDLPARAHGSRHYHYRSQRRVPRRQSSSN